MKLAFCLFKYFPFGGLQRDFKTIIDACIMRGHQIHIYTLEWIGDPLPGVEITIIKKRKLTNHQNYKMFSQYIVNQLHNKDYDAIVGFNKVAGLDVYYAADPCFEGLVERDKHIFYKLNPRYHCFKKLETAIFHPSSQTQILALADAQIQSFHQIYHTPLENFYLMPPWLNQDRFPGEDKPVIRQQLRQEYNLREDEKLILFVGSGFKIKGLDRAIIALSRLPADFKAKTYLFVIGDDKASAFIQLAKKHKINQQIKFLGGRKDVARFMFSADLLLHPAYAENAGYVLMEAIVAGLPVLATDTCGFAPHIVKANAGMVLASPFEQLQLDTALLTMLTDEAKIIQWQKNGLAYPKSCNLHGMPEIAADIIEWQARLPKKTTFGHKNYFIYPELIDYFPSKQTFDAVMQLKGDVYRNLDGRKTLAFKHKNKRYFAKLHSGTGWREIGKNLLQCRLPIISAKNEFKAIKYFEKLALNTTSVVGFGQRGLNPAKRKSFLITKALENTISLEDFTKPWVSHQPPWQLKMRLIKAVASIAKEMHDNGVNHRDFYLCHFLLDSDILNKKDEIKLYVIDLHRAQVRHKIPFRWQVKDIASLYYSTLNIGLTKTDYLRFLKWYTGLPLAKLLKNERFLDRVAIKTYELTNRAFKFDTEITL